MLKIRSHKGFTKEQDVQKPQGMWKSAINWSLTLYHPYTAHLLDDQNLSVRTIRKTIAVSSILQIP